MDPQPYKRVFTRILDAFEPIAYLTIAFALSVPIVMLIVSAATTMLEVADLGVLDTVLAVLDRLLLAFIFVELIATIKITQTERGIFDRAWDLYRRTVLTGGTHRCGATHPTAHRWT